MKARDRHRCLRCGGRGAETHHRRRRNVATGHDPHCICNLVLLCGTCHRWVHSYKGRARAEGFVLLSVVTDPYNRPVAARHGVIYLDCEGSFEARKEHTEDG